MAEVLLASLDDLEDRVGALNDEQKARVPGLLADASADVRAAAGQHISHVTDDVARVRPRGRLLVLRERPVTGVTAVSDAVTGSALAAADWEWDGLDRIHLGAGVSLARAYEVTYSHGYTTIPDLVVGVVCGAVNRVLTASAVMDGVTSETIGQYSVQTPGGQSGVQVRLTSREEARLRARFGRSSSVAFTGAD